MKESTALTDLVMKIFSGVMERWISFAVLCRNWTASVISHNPSLNCIVEFFKNVEVKVEFVYLKIIEFYSHLIVLSGDIIKLLQHIGKTSNNGFSLHHYSISILY